MADKSSDPLALWQKMMGEMEKGYNAFANQAMSSPEFSKAMNQASGATAGAQKQFAELVEKYLLNMNLPSRAQMIGVAERLQNIETQLNEIKATLQQMNAGASSGSVGVVRPPLEVQRLGRLREDIARITQALAYELEILIRAAPEQWHLLQPNWPSDRRDTGEG